MSSVSRLAHAMIRPLATIEGRKRALVALVAAPLVIALAVGAALGALAYHQRWSALAIVGLGVMIVLAAVLSGRWLLGTAQSIRRRHAAAWIPEKLRPLRIEVTSAAPRRISIVHLSVDLKHFFGGFIAVFNLARRLAERGHRVRLIATERSSLPANWRERIAAYEGLAEALDRIEVVFAQDRQPIEMNPEDALIATHWSVAHIAHLATAQLMRKRFLYLIQEYEPFIFPMGSAAALAHQSYELPHFAIFSTELLRDYFATHRIGVFRDGETGGNRNSVVFNNAITPVGPVTEGDLRRPGSPRLLFYARPEQHAQRNLFEIGAMALDRTVAEGCFTGWALTGIGSVEPGDSRLVLPGSGAGVEMTQRQSQAEYASLLRSSDVGLALMYTPHPSLVPIEMAAAGLLTVTNTYENKTPAALAAISPNLIAAEPTVEGVAAALREAAERVADLTARANGSRLNWPSRWEDALDDKTMQAIESLLEEAGA